MRSSKQLLAKRRRKQEWKQGADSEEDSDLLSSDDEVEEQNKHSLKENTTVKESAVEKRNRLARELLARIEAGTKRKLVPKDEETIEEEDEEELMDQALRREVLKAEGRLVKQTASKLHERLQSGAVERSSYRSSHSQSVTCVCLSHDESTCFSGSKDGAIVGWDLEKNLSKWKPNKPKDSRVLGIACSSDGKYLATCGDKNGSLIRIWDLRDSNTRDPVRTLSGHRDTVTQVAFRQGTSMLFSASDDRSVRIYNVAEGSFIESLFGHQSRICGLDTLSRERCVTCAEDLTVRLWKIPEETHLLLSGKHTGPIDCVKMLNENTFVSGAQDGNLALWNVSKRRPICVVTEAHGPKHWVESISTMQHSDVVASGSDDGMIRLWEVNVEKLRINPDPVAALPCTGHVNSLAFGSSGTVLVAGVGQEPRLGRWRVNSDAKNGVVIYRLPPTESRDEVEY